MRKSNKSELLLAKMLYFTTQTHKHFKLKLKKKMNKIIISCH